MTKHQFGSALRTAIALGSLAVPCVSFAATLETKECAVQFSAGTTVASDTAINQCIDSLKGVKVSRIDISGYASPGGSNAVNRKMSQDRADALKDLLSRAFPSTEIVAKGRGADAARGMSAVAVASYTTGTQVGDASGSAPAGQLGQTTPHTATSATDPHTGALLHDQSSQSTAGVNQETPAGQITSFPAAGTLRSNQQPAPMVTGDVNTGDVAVTTTDSTQVAALDTAAASSTSNEQPVAVQRENMRSGWNDIRVAARLGYDKVWDRNEYMNALGADVSYVRRNLGTTLARLEAGATASFLGDFAEDNKNFNFHGTLFPALEVGPLVVGPRGLIGGSWNDTDKEVDFDAGGEGRLGLEASNYSVFFSAGRTKELTRVSVDLGATF